MDTTVASIATRAQWLLLLPQLPPKPDYLRVKLQRRLQRLGAIAIKNGVYVLPVRDQTVEDTEWLRREVADEEGELIVCSAAFTSGLSDESLVDRFQSSRDEEYHAIAIAARQALADGDRDARSVAVASLERTLAGVKRIDFFEADAGADARDAVASLEQSVSRQESTAPESAVVPNIAPGRTWVTRKGVFVDRIASAWLIRRFIDPKAKFKFVDANRRYRVAPNELRFDMYQAEYTHEGDRCTFETLLAKFGLNDVALATIGQIVHDIDVHDDKYQRAETFGINAVLTGIRDAEPRDNRRLAMGRALFDGLYKQFSRTVAAT